MLVVFIGVSTWLQFVVITDLSGQMLTFDGVWHFGEVFSSWMNPGFHCTGQMADWRCVGERFADVNVEDRVGGVMVWAGVCYGQRTQVNFIDGILNAQRYRDEILSPIVVPFIHDYHLILQDDNAWPHVARICTQFLEAEHSSSCMASILTGHVTHWACLGCSGSAYTTACSSSCQYPATSPFIFPLKRSGPIFHRPQSTTWSTLCEGDVLHYLRQMVVTPDTGWFSDPPNTVKLHILEWPFILASLRHTCAIIMLL